MPPSRPEACFPEHRDQGLLSPVLALLSEQALEPGLRFPCTCASATLSSKADGLHAPQATAQPPPTLKMLFLPSASHGANSWLSENLFS